MRRTIFIGDVHGCLEELQELTEKLAITSQDRVLLLGDLINKWPFSLEVIRFVRSRNFECLLGNHEAYFLKMLRKNPEKMTGAFAILRDELTHEELAWLEGLPFFRQEPAFIAVHAGLLPEKTALETWNNPCERSWLLKIREIPAIEDVSEEYIGHPWWKYYDGTTPVIYGHWAKQGLHITHNTYGLDSGCAYGKHLSALILETQEIIQVPARKTYTARE